VQVKFLLFAMATAIKELKNNKAEGIDKIPAVVLKCMGNKAKLFKHMCQKKICETGKWPADFLQTVRPLSFH